MTHTMDSQRSYPRRRYLYHVHPILNSPQSQSTHDVAIPGKGDQPLRKGATFHSPTTPPSKEYDPVLNIPFLPRRSPTCPKDLENAIAAGDGRLNYILGAVDRSLSGLESFSSDSERTLVTDDLPVPRFVLNAHLDDSVCMDVDEEEDHFKPLSRQRSTANKHHASDSGIGSTVSDSEPSGLGDYQNMKDGKSTDDGTFRKLTWRSVTAPICHETGGRLSVSSLEAEGSAQTGINGLALSALGAVTGSQHTLSEQACRQIQKFIILPIIREDKLKDFHPLISGIPYRIARKEITCLRDLEKVLLWLAPVSSDPPVREWSLTYNLTLGVKKWSVSKESFRSFCEATIQCIHTTVDYLNEKDQRRPSDRPYTNGYFLDLVEQVRQYAASLAVSRSRLTSEKMTTNNNEGW